MPYSGPQIVSPAAGDTPIWNYGYIPSLGLCIVGVITFLLVACPHLWLFVTKLGTRSVHGLFFFATLIEALGYGARLSSHNHPFSRLSFLLGIALVQIATILVSASLYKAIQRGIKYTPNGRALSPMRPRSLITLFVILDVVWVLMQIAGQYFYAGAEGAKITGDTPTFATGTSTLIYLAGNVLQAITIIIVSVFVWIILRRSVRLLANPEPSLQYPNLRPLLIQILASLGLFFVRLVVRIAQGAQGPYEYAATHEWVFGLFEYLVSTPTPYLSTIYLVLNKTQPILLILILWAARPLWKFLFPFGHRHGEGAHTRDDVPTLVSEGAPTAIDSGEISTEVKV
ncbi:hypothetical protein BCR39DRAFT_586065 [Naematelia encephala]|uniref:RTA1 like protein-domain-containing protein n=1 Tax=Naematelia encephala TaxID=71784 RepID=A0A1Y2BI83_9TREE|nr:hypothetical protein BCR39DRAFT_586065 [Naematelia encephala]